MSTIRLAQFGMGPIGVETVRLASTRSWASVVGAVDNDPAKFGQTLAGVRVYASFDDLCGAVGELPAVVLHTAGSKAQQAIEQIMPMARRGVSVVSSCEELLDPKLRAPAAAAQLDAACKQSGARVVATGVNPGFVLDLLPVCLTGVSRSVRAIRGKRVVNASTRRRPLQEKIGSGLPPDEFRRLFAQGRLGHAGFKESVSLIAHCMAWTLDALTETCEPVVAERDIRTDFFEVKQGQTRGLHQRCVGMVSGQVKIDLDLTMALDEPDPHDAIVIEGDPPLDVLIRGGVAGDGATVAALVNTVPRLLAATPGLKLLTDLSVPAWFGDRR